MRTTYSDQTILVLTGTFQSILFNGAADVLLLKNDETAGTDTIEYSFNGADKAGEVRPTESFTMDKINGYGSISLRFKSGGAAPDYRLTVIGK